MHEGIIREFRQEFCHQSSISEAYRSIGMSERRVGPTAPAAGLTSEIEAAQEQRLTNGELAAYLAAYRGGDDRAYKHLFNGLKYVAYQFFERARTTKRQSPEEILGSLLCDLGTAVERLKKNNKTPDEIEGYVCGELCHSSTHYAAEVSENIAPPASTNSERLAAGETPYQTLRRYRSRPRHDNSYEGSPNDDVRDAVTPLDAPPPAPRTGQDGTPYYDPYDNEWSDRDWLDRVAETNEEKAYAQFVRDNETPSVIANRLGLSPRQLKALRLRLGRRIERAKKESF
jgi:hypothetical protein